MISQLILFSLVSISKIEAGCGLQPETGRGHKNKETGYRCKLPKFRQSSTKTIQTQSHVSLTSTIVCFLKLYNSEQYSEFSKVVNKMNSRYGSLNVDSSILFVKFFLEKEFVC